ncbi:hypothetical protein QTP88_003456 [Uroleucon formosanum]
MPIRRGHVTQRTTVIETIIRKFDTHKRFYVVLAVSRSGVQVYSENPQMTLSESDDTVSDDYHLRPWL